MPTQKEKVLTIPLKSFAMYMRFRVADTTGGLSEKEH